MIPIVFEPPDGPVLVLGSHGEAVDKAGIAASFGLPVHLVADEVPFEERSKLRREGISVEETPLTETELQHRIPEAGLVFADTGEDELDRAISAIAQEARTPVNVVDKPALCTFIMPAYVRGGTFALAATTFGRAPIASRLLREELEGEFEGFDALVDLLSEWRDKLKDQGLDYAARASRLHQVGTDPQVRAHFAHGEDHKAHARAETILEASP